VYIQWRLTNSISAISNFILSDLFGTKMWCLIKRRDKFSFYLYPTAFTFGLSRRLHIVSLQLRFTTRMHYKPEKMNSFSYDFHIFIRLETLILEMGCNTMQLCVRECWTRFHDVGGCWPTEFSKALVVSSAETVSTNVRQFSREI
jgi:hypothetical protein